MKTYKECLEQLFLHKKILDRNYNIIIDNQKLKSNLAYRLDICKKLDKDFVKAFNKKWWQFWK